MATPDVLLQARLDVDTSSAEKRIQALQQKILKNGKGINPLSGATVGLTEFDKAFNLANKRLLSFAASAAIITGVTGAIREMVRQTILVEKSLTDINVILNETGAGLQKFGSSLFDVAKGTGSSFDEVAKAATEFARQGLSAEQTLKRTEDAMILVRLTGIQTADAVNTLTAAVNSFQKEGITTTEVVNKLAAVDAKFAVSSGDLAKAISRTGSAAVDAGVNFDQLVAIVTSVKQTTAREGAVIGNSFKTIFTRLQRSDTLDQLEELGVGVRDLSGATLPALQILESLAKKYATLSDGQKAATAELVGGVYQINILKAAFSDLSKEISVYNNALLTSSGASDEAAKRNELLNRTLSSSINVATENARKLAAGLGGKVFEPAIRTLTDTFNSFADDISGDGIGASIATSIAKGIGNVLNGPGLLLIGFFVAKVVTQMSRIGVEFARNFISVAKSSESLRGIETNINQIISRRTDLQKQIQSGQISINNAQSVLIGELRAELAARESIYTVVRQTAAAAARIGFGSTTGGTIFKSKAGGYIPRGIIETEVSGARRAGYSISPGDVRMMSGKIDGKKSNIVYNSKETVVSNAGGSGEPMIIPPVYASGGFPTSGFSMDQVIGPGGVSALKQARNQTFTLEALKRAKTKAEAQRIALQLGVDPASIRPKAGLKEFIGAATKQINYKPKPPFPLTNVAPPQRQVGPFDSKLSLQGALGANVPLNSPLRQKPTSRVQEFLTRVESRNSAAAAAPKPSAYQKFDAFTRRPGFQSGLLGAAIGVPLLAGGLQTANPGEVGDRRTPRTIGSAASAIGSGALVGSLVGGAPGAIVGGVIAAFGTLKAILDNTNKSFDDFREKTQEESSARTKSLNGITQAIALTEQIGLTTDPDVAAKLSLQRDSALRDIEKGSADRFRNSGFNLGVGVKEAESQGRVDFSKNVAADVGAAFERVGKDKTLAEVISDPKGIFETKTRTEAKSLFEGKGLADFTRQIAGAFDLNGLVSVDPAAFKQILSQENLGGKDREFIGTQLKAAGFQGDIDDFFAKYDLALKGSGADAAKSGSDFVQKISEVFPEIEKMIKTQKDSIEKAARAARDRLGALNAELAITKSIAAETQRINLSELFSEFQSGLRNMQESTRQELRSVAASGTAGLSSFDQFSGASSANRNESANQSKNLTDQLATALARNSNEFSKSSKDPVTTLLTTFGSKAKGGFGSVSLGANAALKQLQSGDLSNLSPDKVKSILPVLDSEVKNNRSLLGEEKEKITAIRNQLAEMVDSYEKQNEILKTDTKYKQDTLNASAALREATIAARKAVEKQAQISSQFDPSGTLRGPRSTSGISGLAGASVNRSTFDRNFRRGSFGDARGRQRASRGADTAEALAIEEGVRSGAILNFDQIRANTGTDLKGARGTTVGRSTERSANKFAKGAQSGILEDLQSQLEAQAEAFFEKSGVSRGDRLGRGISGAAKRGDTGQIRSLLSGFNSNRRGGNAAAQDLLGSLDTIDFGRANSGKEAGRATAELFKTGGVEDKLGVAADKLGTAGDKMLKAAEFLLGRNAGTALSTSLSAMASGPRSKDGTPIATIIPDVVTGRGAQNRLSELSSSGASRAQIRSYRATNSPSVSNLEDIYRFDEGNGNPYFSDEESRRRAEEDYAPIKEFEDFRKSRNAPKEVDFFNTGSGPKRRGAIEDENGTWTPEQTTPDNKSTNVSAPITITVNSSAANGEGIAQEISARLQTVMADLMNAKTEIASLKAGRPMPPTSMPVGLPA